MYSSLTDQLFHNFLCFLKLFKYYLLYIVSDAMQSDIMEEYKRETDRKVELMEENLEQAKDIGANGEI